MTIVALCIEAGVVGEQFICDLAATLELQILDLQRLDFAGAAASLHGREAPCCYEAGFESIETEQIFAHIAAEALEMAARGNVLVIGWSAAVVLLPLAHVLRVLIRAPLPLRAWNAVLRFRPWSTNVPERPDPRDFDLVLDAGSHSVHECKREIAALLDGRECQGGLAPGDEPARCFERRRNPGDRVVIGIDDVSLTGVNSQEAAIARIEQHLRGKQDLPQRCNPLCRRVGE